MKDCLRFLALFITLLASVLACRDSEPIVPFPARYVGTQLKTVGNVRLFTAGGELSDRSVISRHVGRLNAYTMRLFKTTSFYERDTTLQLDRTDTLSILAQNLAAVNRRQYTIKASGQDLLFIAKDTVHNYYQNRDEVYSLNTLLDVTKYNPAYVSPDFNSPSLTLPVRSKLVLLFAGTRRSDDELIFYSMRYAVSNWIQVRMQTINDRFAPNGYKRLRAGDTLTVQEFDLTFRK